MVYSGNLKRRIKILCISFFLCLFASNAHAANTGGLKKVSATIDTITVSFLAKDGYMYDLYRDDTKIRTVRGSGNTITHVDQVAQGKHSYYIESYQEKKTEIPFYSPAPAPSPDATPADPVPVPVIPTTERVNVLTYDDFTVSTEEPKPVAAAPAPKVSPATFSSPASLSVSSPTSILNPTSYLDKFVRNYQIKSSGVNYVDYYDVNLISEHDIVVITDDGNLLYASEKPVRVEIHYLRENYDPETKLLTGTSEFSTQMVMRATNLPLKFFDVPGSYEILHSEYSQPDTEIEILTQIYNLFYWVVVVILASAIAYVFLRPLWDFWT